MHLKLLRTPLAPLIRGESTPTCERLLPKVAYVTNASVTSGVGLQAGKILEQLRTRHDMAVTVFHLDGAAGELLHDGKMLVKLRRWPGILGSKTVGWVRLGRLLRSQLREYDLVHLTNQTLSFIRPAAPYVVTVHDLIELQEPQSGFGGWAARYLYRGLRQANHLIAVSKYTKQVVVQQLGIAPESITVIYNGTDSDFHVIEDFASTVGYQTLRKELRLGTADKVVLYVGSDHPRKNVIGALRAFAAVASSMPQAIFVKIGAAGLPAGRLTTLEAIDSLNIRDRVRVIDTVSQDRLNELYNLASVLLFPSLHEGFGLPPLQAMAAGTPVVTSNSTSLPEVVGDAALTCDPLDNQYLQESLVRVLTDADLAAKLSAAGLVRAKQFTWKQAGLQVVEVYNTNLIESLPPNKGDKGGFLEKIQTPPNLPLSGEGLLKTKLSWYKKTLL